MGSWRRRPHSSLPTLCQAWESLPLPAMTRVQRAALSAMSSPLWVTPIPSRAFRALGSTSSVHAQPALGPYLNQGWGSERRPLCPHSALPDTLCPQSAVPDTMCPEPAVPDKLGPQSALLDTMRPETAVPDTMRPESAVPDTMSPESAVPDTMSPESALPDTMFVCLVSVIAWIGLISGGCASR